MANIPTKQLVDSAGGEFYPVTLEDNAVYIDLNLESPSIKFTLTTKGVTSKKIVTISLGEYNYGLFYGSVNSDDSEKWSNMYNIISKNIKASGRITITDQQSYDFDTDYCALSINKYRISGLIIDGNKLYNEGVRETDLHDINKYQYVSVKSYYISIEIQSNGVVVNNIVEIGNRENYDNELYITLNKDGINLQINTLYYKFKNAPSYGYNNYQKRTYNVLNIGNGNSVITFDEGDYNNIGNNMLYKFILDTLDNLALVDLTSYINANAYVKKRIIGSMDSRCLEVRSFSSSINILYNTSGNEIHNYAGIEFITKDDVLYGFGIDYNYKDGVDTYGKYIAFTASNCNDVPFR